MADYVVAPFGAMRTLDFNDVKEDSWDTCRWSADQSQAIVHFDSLTTSLTNWLRAERLDRSIIRAADVNPYVRTTDKNTWITQPAPPIQP